MPSTAVWHRRQPVLANRMRGVSARTSERRAQARRLVKNSIISVEQPDEELEEDEWADEAGAAAEAVAAARAAGGAGAGGAAGAGRSP